MTSSLALLVAASVVAGLMGAPSADVTNTENRFRAASAAQALRPLGTAVRTTATIPGGTDVVEHVATVSAAERRRVLDYWTPGRMAAALPISLLGTLKGALVGPRVPARHQAARPGAGASTATSTGGSRWTAGGLVGRTTGRVFLTLGGVDFVCSASSVKGANKDLVVTAGHCVKDGTGAWADNWTFVPGYDRGRQPYGQFTARRMFVAGPWSRSADDNHDVGMVALNKNGTKHLADVVGAQDISFGAPRGRQTYGFGFPVDPPYNGEHLIYCAGPVRADPHDQTGDQGLGCTMTAGSSGGPWFSDFNPATGRGVITSVSSFKYSDDQGTMYGPYFGNIAKDLYTIAQNA
ncbi:trypsin-like serine peptidase [Planobispora siamensis]|uniref:Peptidase n=1 Tax=Planobispora siamensis TaxID=936338 RepID=A0A8J3SLJ6_9ACTN|nr:trypsin-like serine protease [Planobispora siamensis]GIH96656.1 peptidase [Planobispora siamensis]